MPPRTCYTAPLDDAPLESLIVELPKAELHLHLEGAYRWETIRRHHPAGPTLPDEPPWYVGGVGRFASFAEFLQTFADYVRPATATPDAIAAHVADVVADLVAQKVRYAEILASPMSHGGQGLSHREVLVTLRDALAGAVAGQPIEVRFIYGLLGRRDPAQVLSEVREAADLVGVGPDGLFVGVDLMDSGEPEMLRAFADVFAVAADLGVRCRAHTGEVVGPEGVAVAVEELGLRHLSHGVRAVEDADLLARLCAAGVWFHVCTTSNVALGVASSHSEHPLHQLLARGAQVTVSSDDPLLFGCTLIDEYRNLLRGCRLEPRQLVALVEAGFTAALLSAEARAALIAEVREVAGRHGVGD